jgi:UDP-2-acetamido-3-amino-2,3-dideoxy-glucuronate N-acetyltransferase
VSDGALVRSYYVHERALCETEDVGPGTRIWAFAHVLEGARLGADCNICDGVFIEGGARVGDRVTVKCGVQLWTGVTLEDDVFVGPNATFTNDRFPRSKHRPADFARTTVRAGASIGANATILPGLEIGGHAMVGAGTVVTRSVPPNAIVVGNPARIVGYVGAGASSPLLAAGPAPLEPEVRHTDVEGVTWHRLPVVTDMRGTLSVGEFQRSVPFEPRRYFLVYGVPHPEVRGEHAHHVCHQFLVCVTGSCSVTVDDGRHRNMIVLDAPNQGIYLPPGVWAMQSRFSTDAVLLVFASHYYDPADYIRSYDEFLAVRRSTPEP